ncbi:MAG: hypothetical protein JSU96_08325, partial [Acidobacteriota bacterium]
DAEGHSLGPVSVERDGSSVTLEHPEAGVRYVLTGTTNVTQASSPARPSFATETVAFRRTRTEKGTGWFSRETVTGR